VCPKQRPNDADVDQRAGHEGGLPEEAHHQQRDDCSGNRGRPPSALVGHDGDSSQVESEQGDDPEDRTEDRNGRLGDPDTSQDAGMRDCLLAPPGRDLPMGEPMHHQEHADHDPYHDALHMYCPFIQQHKGSTCRTASL